MKKTVLKDYISFSILSINIMIIFFNIMLLAELNKCFLFYSISLNIILLNNYLLNKYSSKKFKNEFIYNLLDDEM